MSPRRHARLLLLLMSALLAWVAGAAAPERARSTRAPSARLLGVVDPGSLPVAAETEGDVSTGVTVGNVFPDPADIPRGELLPLDFPAPEGELTWVFDPGNVEDAVTAFPSIDVSFDGPYHGGIAPPDPVMAAGRHDVVALINQRIAMYDRNGVLIQGPFTLRSFFGIPSGFSSFDPLALYDPHSDRFIVVCTSDNGGADDSRLYIAFSQSSEAAGSWNKYYIQANADQPNVWADYPSIGVDRLAVYLTANMFNRGGSLNNVTLFVYDKEDGYAGLPLDNTHLINVLTAGGGAPFRLRPAWIDEVVPGDEYYLMQADGAFGSQINLLRLTGDRFDSPTVSAETVALSGLYFTGGNGRQPGDGGVASLGASLWNVVYRAGRLWTAHAISGSSGLAAQVHRVDVRTKPAVREETYVVEAAGNDAYFPHVLPDAEDNDFALVTAYSGPEQYVTGRYWNVAADGTLRTAELLTAGVLRNTSERHGDYFAANIDPTDGNRLWMTAGYMKSSTFSGQQVIASVRFEDVAPPSSPPPVPGGQGVGGEPLLVEKSGGGDLTLTWDATSCPAAETHLMWYDLAGISSYTVTDETCATGDSGVWTGAPPSGNVGVIVVSDDGGTVEGSHGADSEGRERSSASSLCGLTQKRTDGQCLP